MKRKTGKAASKNRLSLLALEPRMVFDGALAVTDPNWSDPSQGLDPSIFQATPMAAFAAQSSSLLTVDNVTVQENAGGLSVGGKTYTPM
ncbi:MAG: hypothetical protein ACOVO0_10970, partial [Burkholderiaceae bacterium]